MPAEPRVTAANTVAPAVRNRSVAPGDVPEHLRRRYFLDGRGGAGLAFYADAQVKAPAFRDQGRKLATARNDPNAIRDMTAIAKHRGWAIVVVTGSEAFRREAWIASRVAGLEVRGYRPTERDLQALDRRNEQRDRADRERAPKRQAQSRDAGAEASLRVVEAVVRSRIAEPSRQEEILRGARQKIATWLERGAPFGAAPAQREPLVEQRRERSRSR